MFAVTTVTCDVSVTKKVASGTLGTVMPTFSNGNHCALPVIMGITEHWKDSQLLDDV
jgi:hypothetical protein